MTLQKRIFSQLSKNSKKKFNKYRAKLGITQDLNESVDAYFGTLETAEKIVSISKNVNNKIEQLTDDVRFYNTYAEMTYDDLKRYAEIIQGLLDKASELANELGVSEEDIDGYKRASDFLIDLKSSANSMISNPLEFDI